MKNILITTFIATFFLGFNVQVTAQSNEGSSLIKKVDGIYLVPIDTSSWPFSFKNLAVVTIVQSNNDKKPQIAMLIEKDLGEEPATCSIISNISSDRYGFVSGSKTSYGQFGNIKGISGDLLLEMKETGGQKLLHIWFTLEQSFGALNDSVWISEKQRIGVAPPFSSVVSRCQSFAEVKQKK